MEYKDGYHEKWAKISFIPGEGLGYEEFEPNDAFFELVGTTADTEYKDTTRAEIIQNLFGKDEKSALNGCRELVKEAYDMLERSEKPPHTPPDFNEALWLCKAIVALFNTDI